jgi:hypothetical protein
MPNISLVKVTSPPVVDTLKVFTASFFRFHFEPILGTMSNAAVPVCQCSYHLTGNANNSRRVSICPHSHHDPMEIPEPSSNHNTIHPGKAYDGAYFAVLEKF